MMGKKFKEWRRAVLLRLGEKGLEGALKPVDEHYLMVHEDNVTALQSKGKEVPKYMWIWEEWYGDREKENENEEEESVREVNQTRKDREETEVTSPLTMKQSTPSVADKRASTRLKEAVERLRKVSEVRESMLASPLAQESAETEEEKADQERAITKKEKLEREENNDGS
eukprot:g45829.t1